jgi:hypothetical protein
MRRTIGVVFVALLWAGGMFLVVVWLLNYLDGTRQSNWLLLVGGTIAAVATVALAEDAVELVWRRNKPPWEVEYAQNLYGAFVAGNDPGDITALRLKIPTALHAVYQSKVVLQRELISFVALAAVAKERGLEPVLIAYGNLIVDKMAKRGLQMSDEQMANAAFDDADELFAQPFRWAQEWLAEFGENAKDNYILFAEHWLALFKAWKNAIEKTHRR